MMHPFRHALALLALCGAVAGPLRAAGVYFDPLLGTIRSDAAGSVVAGSTLATAFESSGAVTTHAGLTTGAHGITSPAAISGHYLVYNTTADATPAALYLNGTSTRMTLPANTTWRFDILVAGVNATDHAGIAYQRRGAIHRGNAGTTALLGDIIKEDFEAAGQEACEVNITADDTNEALVITVIGLAGKSIKWRAIVITSEVTE